MGRECLAGLAVPRLGLDTLRPPPEKTQSADTAACLQLPLVNHDPSILVFGKETARCLLFLAPAS